MILGPLLVVMVVVGYPPRSLPSLSLSSLSPALENVFPSPLPKRSISRAAKDLTDFDFLSSLCLSFSLPMPFFLFIYHCLVITPPKTLSYVVGLRTKDPELRALLRVRTLCKAWAFSLGTWIPLELTHTRSFLPDMMIWGGRILNACDFVSFGKGDERHLSHLMCKMQSSSL
jgi:hypothetical protein